MNDQAKVLPGTPPSAELPGARGEGEMRRGARPPAVPKPAAAQRFEVRIVSAWQDLAALGSEWDDLASDAEEPAPSCERWMLVPALREGIPGRDVRVALVYASGLDGDAAGAAPVLCGVAPLETGARYRSLRVVALWNHIYAVSAAPLVRRGCGARVIDALLRWIAAECPARTLFHVPEVRVTGAFYGALREHVAAERAERIIVDLWARAQFHPRADAERYLQGVGTGHHRHEWRRQARRLADLGTLAYTSLDDARDVARWTDDFVALEMRGWKGREGTAFGSDARHRAWLNEVVAEAFARGRLMMLSLTLDGRPIAMKLNLLSPPGAYAFKIAYDETLVKYSPGVLLELDNIQRLHAMPQIEWMDSLAAPNHSLMERVWVDRTAMASLLVAPGPAAGRLLLAGVPLLRAVKRSLQPGSTAK